MNAHTAAEAVTLVWASIAAYGLGATLKAMFR